VWVHWLDVTFATADGVTHTKSANVANTIYDRYAVGRPVQVTYVKSNPDYFHIAGTEPTQRDVGISDGMFRYGAIASAVCLVGLVGALLVGGGRGDAPAPRAPLREEARQNRSGRPRASFGTRRA
jgi:hypothetical protein